MIQQIRSQYNQPFLNDRVSSISSISSQEMENCIIIRPKREIVFKYMSNKDITADFEIINQSHTKKYLYRILCTSSKSYKVEPYKGEINPNQKIQVKSILISKGADIEKRMKDQFKVEYICLEDDFIDKNLAWDTFPKREIRLSISVMFYKQSAKSNSPNRNMLNGVATNSVNDYYFNKSQKSFYSPNQSQLQNNNSQISQSKAMNSQISPRNNQYLSNANVMNNSNEFNSEIKYPEESKFTRDNFGLETQSKTLKLTNTYSLNSSDKQQQIGYNPVEENIKYQQKFNLLRKRQDEQVELIKSYKEDIKKFHNEISKLKFIFRKNESSIDNTSESKYRFLLQPYQLSILIFAFLIIGALLKI